MSEKKRVLIVDDSPSNIRILNDNLKDEYRIMIATDGEKALAITKRHTPDIILLDIMMPVMDGYEVCKRLKSDPATSDIPIIFVTFKTDIEDEEKGFKVGAVDYITRPISSSIVKARVKTHLMLRAHIADLKKGQEELQNAKQAAEAANRIKSEFLATMSHEIRTPMNGIIGLTDLLFTTQLSDTQRQYLENLRYSAYSLLDIINDILDISKIESDKLKLEDIEFNLPDIVDKTVFMMSNRASEKGISLFTDIASDIPQNFIGDPVRIRQIILNLIGNAVKFTEKGEIAVSVRKADCESYELEEYNTKLISPIVISVKDTGIGIPEDKLSAIFDSFTQADGSVTRKYGGTGLGLSISKKLAKMMNGNITVQSVYGEGSCFRVYLPLPYVEKSKIRRQVDDKSFINIVEYLPSYRGTILIAEDNPINMLVIRTYLSKMGFDIIEAVNGREAVSQYMSNEIDIIFMDIHMPEMNGLEATRKIREYETLRQTPADKNKRTPIIALTADAFKDDKDKCMAEGMDYYLAKPFRPDHIINVLQKVLPERLQATHNYESVTIDNKVSKNVRENEENRSDIKKELEAGSVKNNDCLHETIITKNCQAINKNNQAENLSNDFPIFERELFLSRIEHNMPVYEHVLKGFMTNIPKLLSKLHLEIEKEAIKEIGFQAHAIKGSCLTIGACRLSEIARQIEQAARNNSSIEEIKRIYENFEPAFKEFREEAEKY